MDCIASRGAAAVDSSIEKNDHDVCCPMPPRARVLDRIRRLLIVCCVFEVLSSLESFWGCRLEVDRWEVNEA